MLYYNDGWNVMSSEVLRVFGLMSASWRSSILCVARPCSATHQKDGDYVGDANREGPHGSQARVSVVRLERRVATQFCAGRVIV